MSRMKEALMYGLALGLNPDDDDFLDRVVWAREEELHSWEEVRGLIIERLGGKHSAEWYDVDSIAESAYRQVDMEGWAPCLTPEELDGVIEDHWLGCHDCEGRGTTASSGHQNDCRSCFGTGMAIQPDPDDYYDRKREEEMTAWI